MIPEELRNLATMARALRNTLDRIAYVAEDLAGEAQQLMDCAVAEPRRITGALPDNVVDLRDPAMWRKSA